MNITWQPSEMREAFLQKESLSLSEWLKSMKNMPLSVQSAVNTGQNIRVGDEHTKVDMLTYKNAPIHISAIRI